MGDYSVTVSRKQWSELLRSIQTTAKQSREMAEENRKVLMALQGALDRIEKLERRNEIL